MKILRLDVSEIARQVAPRQKGVWYTKHHKPEAKQEAHNLTLIVGGKYGTVGKGIYTIRKQGQSNNQPLDAA